jgi:hypothetical protein
VQRRSLVCVTASAGTPSPRTNARISSSVKEVRNGVSNKTPWCGVSGAAYLATSACSLAGHVIIQRAFGVVLRLRHGRRWVRQRSDDGHECDCRTCSRVTFIHRRAPLLAFLLRSLDAFACDVEKPRPSTLQRS